MYRATGRIIAASLARQFQRRFPAFGEERVALPQAIGGIARHSGGRAGPTHLSRFRNEREEGEPAGSIPPVTAYGWPGDGKL